MVHSAGIQDRVAARAVLMRLFCRFDIFWTDSDRIEEISERRQLAGYSC
jgi:hypothetical protein